MKGDPLGVAIRAGSSSNGCGHVVKAENQFLHSEGGTPQWSQCSTESLEVS